MTDPDLWTVILSRSDNPIVYVLIAATGFYLFLSKRLAELKGSFAWVGAAARWWTTRQRRHVEVDLETWRVTHKADREREASEIKQLREDLNYFGREVTDMRRRERLHDQQARVHSDWDNTWVPQARAAGIEVSDPPPLYLDLAPLYVPEDTS